MNNPIMRLNSAQVIPALRLLFDQPMPTEMRCAAVLDGSVAGQIWTDDIHQPTWGVVRETAMGTTFLGGALDAARVKEIIKELQREGDVVFGAYADDRLIALLPTPFEYDGWAINYTDRPLHQGLDAYLPVPEACVVRRVDAALFKRSVDLAMNIAASGSIEKAHQDLIGFYLMRGDEILCEAFAHPAAHGIREVGIVTYEAHRQHGYATITCAHLIWECEQLGFQTLWNCAKQNLGSNALARKFGYRKAQEYRVFAWFKGE